MSRQQKSRGPQASAAGDDFSRFCQECRRSYQQRYGDFLIRCHGIVPAESQVPGEVLRRLTPEERSLVLSLYDPVLWAKLHCNWEPRCSADGLPYQALMLRCTAHRKVFRCGRRIGKTSTIAIKILHFMSTTAHGKVLLVTPFAAQVELIFKFIKEHLSRNPALQQSVKRHVSSPHHELEMHNGSYICGFTSGSRSGAKAGSVRGQAADIIVLDEADFLHDGDIDTIAAILHDHPDTQLWASSTPSGKRGKFWQYCNSPRFKEFHFPSHCLPHWNAEMEAEAREHLTDLGYIHEVLAEFGDEEAGVFPKRFIEAAITDYDYCSCAPEEHWVYGLGVDWNSDQFGTEILAVGWDGSQLQVVDAVNVGRSEWSFQMAVEAVILANRKWRPLFIYADEGYGSMQIETLRRHGFNNVGRNPIDARLKDIVVGINFSSQLEIYDPLTRQPVKKPLKPFLVENAVRLFERHAIRISRADQQLIQQLENYIIKRRTETGMPVYAPRSERIGDHKLDALMLALLGFTQNLGELALRVSHDVYVVQHPLRAAQDGSGRSADPQLYTFAHPEQYLKRPRLVETGRLQLSPLASSVYGTHDLWGADQMLYWPGCMRDEPPPRARLGRGLGWPRRHNL